MDMTQYAGSEGNYLKATDLQGGTPKVVIKDVELVQFDDNDDKDKKITKPVLALEGKEKKLVLNPTNTDAIIKAFGPESSAWHGKTIMLATKFYSGVGKEGIVVTPLKSDGFDDDIPF